jgi:filamentous hemagglutinin family protein
VITRPLGASVPRQRPELLAGTALSALVASGLFMFTAPGWAQVSGVTGGSVVAGQATIANTAPGQVTVTQSTQRGVIDWRSFSIGAGERVDFVQPGVSSITLNRVTGPDPSVIAGRLNANGQLILVNGAGVVFANGAQINAAGLVASTTNVSDTQRFMQGGTVVFDRPSSNANAGVSNAGTITVREGGLVGLAGQTASNSGTINARLGQVTLAGAETFTVDLAGDGLINFQVGNPVTRQPLDGQGNKRPLVANSGTINADGGTVTLTARAARGVVDGVVNAGGTINARAVRDEGGIVVFGADDATVNVTGTVDVSAAGKTQRGGQVLATTARGTINVASTARIDASGGSGGGTVLIGGGKQGQGPVATARNTNVAKGATIRADATERGTGGTVVIWADNATVFAGSISATGGPRGGDGGFVEVSGKTYLDFTGAVDLRASGGVVGTLLLDPSDITIQNGGSDDTSETGGDPNTITGKSDASILRVSVLEAALAKANVIVDASGGSGNGTGSITLSDNVASDFGGLTLKAITDITLNANIRLGAGNGTGVLTLISTTGNVAGAGGGIKAAAVNLSVGGNVTLTNAGNTFAELVGTVGGSVTVSSANSLTIGNSPTTGLSGLSAATALSVTTTGANSNLTVGGTVSGAGVTLVAAKNLSGAGAIAAGAGSVALTASGSGGINLSGAITGASLVAKSANGGVTLNGTDNVFNSFTAASAVGGNVTVVHKGALAVNAIDVGSSTASFTTNTGGNLTLAGTLDATGGVTLAAAGTLAVNAAINTAGATVTLSGTSITQSAAGSVTASALAVTATGDVDLTQATSAVATFAAAAGGNVGFRESNGFDVGAIGAINGVTAAGNVRFQAGGTISQSQPISAAGLGVATTAGSITLTETGNSVTTFAASSAGGVTFAQTGAVDVGSVGAVGSLPALAGITATTNVALTSGGTISQTQAIAASGIAATSTGGDVALDGATNTASNVALAATGNAAYKASGTITVTDVAGLSGVVVSGTTTLITTGAASGITQAKPIETATLAVSTGGSGTITLTNGGNRIGTLISAVGGIGTGATTVVDGDGGLNVGPITAGGPLSLTTSGGALVVVGAINTSAGNADIALTSSDDAVSVNASLSAGTGTVTLRSAGSANITASASPTAAITAGTLALETGAGGGATIDAAGASHSIGKVTTTGSGVGTGGVTLVQSRAAGLSVGPLTSAGAVTITEGAGPLSVVGTIDTAATGANVTLNASAGALSVNGQIATGTGQVALLAQQAISQASSSAGITAGSLRAVNTSGDISLNPTGLAAGDVNAVTTIAATTGGGLFYSSGGAITIGTVGGTVGVTTSTGKSVTLTVTGAGGSITQSAGAAGAITTGTISLTTAGGDVTLDGANNAIGAIGAVNLGAGKLTLVNDASAGLNVGAITANGGIAITNKSGDLTTSAAIASDGDIALTSGTGVLTLGGTVTSNVGKVTLRANGALDTGAFLVSAPTAVTGDVTLISDTSTVTIGAGGVTVGDTLAIQIGAGLTLSVSGAVAANSVTLIADQMIITAPISAPGTITLAPVTPGTAVTVGDSTAPAGLVVDNAELVQLASAATLTIGDGGLGTITAGSIRVGAATVGNATLNLRTSGGITQDGQLSVGAGTGTLTVAAAATINLNTSGIDVGVVGGSTTAGDFLVLKNGVAGGLLVSGMSTAGGQIAVRNLAGDLTVGGPMNSGGGTILLGSNTGASAVNVNATVDASTGNVGIFASAGGIVQGGGGIVAGNLLAEIVGSATGAISLASTANQVTGNVTLNAGSAGGNIDFRNSGAFIVGGLPTMPTAVGTLVPPLGSGIRAAATATVTLTAGGPVTQAMGAGDIIAAGTLSVAGTPGANPNVTLTNPANTVAVLGAVTIGTGAFAFTNAGDLQIAGSANAGGGYTVVISGALTQVAGTIDVGPTGTVTLQGGSSVVQVGGQINAAQLDAVATAAGGIVALNAAGNAFAVITGTGAAGFSATTAQALTVGAGGVQASAGAVSLTALGGASDLTVGGPVTAGSNVTLSAGRDIILNAPISASVGLVSLLAGRDIRDSAAGGISAASLRAVATAGTVDLSAAAAGNNVALIAGSAGGGFTYVDGNTSALTVGTLTNVGVTSATGDVTVQALAGTLTVSSPVSATAAGGDVTLQAQGNLSFATTVAANAGNGRVSLTSTAGSVQQATFGATVSGAELLANAAVNVDLSLGGHAVGATGFAATASAGYMAFLNNSALQLDAVGGTNGVTAGGAVFIGVSSGDLTQTANGIITAGSGLALFTGGSVVLDQSNQINGNISVVNAGGNVTVRNVGDINVGIVGPLAVSVGTFTSTRIAASTAPGAFVLLRSDSGAITQSAGVDGQIIGGELRVITSNRDATLTNAGNQFTSVGNSNLGTGRLTVVDSVGDLTLSAPVIADGGVILTTPGVFTLPGSISVANGDISLTSLTSAINLGSDLSAPAGQVQLDAGGGTITQAAGSTITAKSLIARAPGDVDLTQAGNNVGTIAGASTTGTFKYRDTTAVTVGTLTDSTAGVVSGITTANRDVTIVAGAGGASGGITINAPINTGFATVRLQTGQGDITQGPGAPITAFSLLANAANGSVELGGSTNSIVFVSGSALGSTFTLISSGDIVVSAIPADGITTTAGGIVANNGNITLQSGGLIILDGIVNAANGAATPGPGAGSVILTATGGPIIQTAAGMIVGDGLLAAAQGAVDLPLASNSLNRLAGAAVGSFRFRGAISLTVDSIGGVNGVSAIGGDVGINAGGSLTVSQPVSGATVRLQASAGDVMQGATGAISATTLLVHALGGGAVVLTNPTNQVLSVAGTAGDNFRIVSGAGLTVSPNFVAGDPGIAINGAVGITAGTGRLVDLGVSAGNLNVAGPISVNAGMIVYRRLAGAPSGDITINGAGVGTGGAYLLIADLTGTSSLALTGLSESGPGAKGSPSGLFTTPTPPTTSTPPGLGGTNGGGTLVIGALQGIDTTVYLVGGSSSTITSSAPGQFGVLGVYALEGSQVRLLSTVRAIPNTEVHPIGPFGPGAPGPVSGPADIVARNFVRKGGLPSISQRFNNCVIAGPSCTTIFTQIADPPTSVDESVIGFAGSSLDDSSIILVNQGNEEFIDKGDGEEEDRRRAGGRR